MALLLFTAGLTAVLVANPSAAFVVPSPEQMVLRHGSPSSASVSASTRSWSRSTKGLRSTPLMFSTKPDFSVASPVVATAADHPTVFASQRLSGAGGEPSRMEVDSGRPSATRSLKAVSGEAGGEGSGNDLTALRRGVLLGVWLLFVAYAFGPWSPGASADPKDIDLVTHLYDAPAGPQTAIFFNIFNSLGVLPAVMGSMLIGGGAFGKGRQPVPPQPFVFGAFGLGFFAMGPYLALRNYLPETPDEGEEMSVLEKVLTSKVLALPVLAVMANIVFSLASSLTDPESVSYFSELFWSSKLCHISTLDFCVLNVAIVDPVREDMRRRGVEPELAKVALFSVPLLGPALWMLIRPPVEN